MLPGERCVPAYEMSVRIDGSYFKSVMLLRLSIGMLTSGANPGLRYEVHHALGMTREDLMEAYPLPSALSNVSVRLV